jgi:peptidoglycan/LPS O-acetylase OafA/YrhL
MWFVDKFMEPHNSRVVGLDIVRAIAILLVVYGHGVYLNL